MALIKPDDEVVVVSHHAKADDLTAVNLGESLDKVDELAPTKLAVERIFSLVASNPSADVIIGAPVLDFPIT